MAIDRPFGEGYHYALSWNLGILRSRLQPSNKEAIVRQLYPPVIPLNRMTVNAVQCFPRAEDIVGDIGSCSLLASLDPRFAQWQI